jgi:hypothetical protein
VYVTSARRLRRLTGAYTALAADVYWVRGHPVFRRHAPAVGRGADRGPEPPRRPRARRRTNTQPVTRCSTSRRRSIPASTSLSLRGGVPGGTPSGRPGRPDLAIKLLEKGLAERPDNGNTWKTSGSSILVPARLPGGRGLVQEGADLPKAPWWLRSLAPRRWRRVGPRLVAADVAGDSRVGRNRLAASGRRAAPGPVAGPG